MSLIAAVAATAMAVIAAVLINLGHPELQLTSLQPASAAVTVPVPVPATPQQPIPLGLLPVPAASQQPPLLPEGSVAASVAPDEIAFKSGTTTFADSTAATSELVTISVQLAANSSLHVAVEGFTVDVGPTAEQLRLSLERAERVSADLTALGVSSTQIAAEGYGSISRSPSIAAQNVVRIILTAETVPKR